MFPGMSKRQKEMARAQKKKAKAQERQKRRDDKSTAPAVTTEDGVDPDIAHIIPGPQPLPEE